MKNLTPRENEVLSLLSIGDSNKIIGAKLGITPQTVRNHLKIIYIKLSVENRVQAAIRGMK